MDIYAYKETTPNLGDDLNHWLWKRILPQSFLIQPGTFIGIGSVVSEAHFQNINTTGPLHIFGAGCRQEVTTFKNINNEIIYHFLRGPLSTQSLNLTNHHALIDGAYAIYFTEEYKRLTNLPKKYKYTLIPFYYSKNLIYYSMLRNIYDVNILHSSDYGNVGNALRTIAQSEYVISESLHGAILADILRVPWARLNFYLKNTRDQSPTSFKWKDWQHSLEMDSISTLDINFLLKTWYSENRNLLLRPARTLDYLKGFTTDLNYQLSDEYVLYNKLETLNNKLDELK